MFSVLLMRPESDVDYLFFISNKSKTKHKTVKAISKKALRDYNSWLVVSIPTSDISALNCCEISAGLNQIDLARRLFSSWIATSCKIMRLGLIDASKFCNHNNPIRSHFPIGFGSLDTRLS